MCEACDEAETVYIPHFGKPGGWRPLPSPPAPLATPTPADDERRHAGEPPRFACDRLAAE